MNNTDVNGLQRKLHRRSLVQYKNISNAGNLVITKFNYKQTLRLR